MSRDWFSPVEEFCSRLRRKVEAARLASLPVDIQHQQDTIHEREELLLELQAIQSRKLAALSTILVTGQVGASRPLHQEEVAELQNPLIAVNVLRAGELLNGQPLLLDRSRLPTHIDGQSTESITLGCYADDLEAVGARIELVREDLVRLRAELEAEVSQI